MPVHPTLNPVAHPWGRAVLQTMSSWWFMVHFGAVVLVMALSPSTYNRHHRAATSRYIYRNTWEVLPWFTVMSTLLSLVLIRVVVVTALSYGLSQYALQMVVRVLVLELIPLSVAMFVALRAGLTFNGTQKALHTSPACAHFSLERLRADMVPQVLASTFAVVTLAMVSSVVALVLAYLTVYGVSPWGLPGYTRTVGQVFDLEVTLGFVMKTLLFSWAVAVVPMAASLETARQPSAHSDLQPGAVRLFMVLLLIEAASLAIKYV